MATINPRPQSNGKIRYQATVRRRGYPPRSKTFNRKRDAERWAHGMETEMDRGGLVDRKVGQETPLSDVLERYIREVSAGKKGWREETNKIRYMIRNAPFARKGVANVTPTDIAYWRDAMLREGKSNSTTRNYMAVLSGAYKHAIKEWRLLEMNPVRAVNWPSPGKGRNRRLAVGDEEKLLKHADVREAAFIKLLIGTAMRYGEALYVTDECLQHGYIYLPETKNGHERYVPLSSELLKTLRACPVDPETRRFFPWKYWHWRQRFGKLTEAAKITGLRTHDLRHEGISRLYEMGLDTFEVMAISGHTTIRQSASYTHLRVDRLKAKMDAG